MVSFRLLVLAVYALLLLQGTAVSGDPVTSTLTAYPASSASPSPPTTATAASPFTTAPVLASSIPASSSVQGVSSTALSGTSAAATPPLPASITAIPSSGTVNSSAPSSATTSPSILPSASESPVSTVPVIQSFPAYEDSNTTNAYNGTFPPLQHDKKTIMSSPAVLGGVVVAAVIGGVGLAVAVVIGVSQLRRRLLGRNQDCDKTELFDASIYYCDSLQDHPDWHARQDAQVARELDISAIQKY